MSNNNSLDVVGGETLLKLVGGGDTSSLTGDQKLAYYRARCEAAGIDPRTAPFQFIKLQGKETLYATKGATDQLASNNKIRLEVISQTTEHDIRIVMVRATSADGRQTDEMGAVPIGGIKGADLANAYMKAITKAKRRAILSLCGLGMLDETEIETIPSAEKTSVHQPKRLSDSAAGNPVPAVVSTTAIPPDPKPHEIAMAAIAQAQAVPGVKCISLAQAKRYFAIAKGAGKTDEEIKGYLSTLGITRSTEMPVEKYEAACAWAALKAAIINTDTGEVLLAQEDIMESPGIGE